MTRPAFNAMTVDVEDYFHANALSEAAPREHWDAFPSRVEANTNRLLDQFATAGVHVTCFVLGWVAERHPALVRRIVADGHELASHGYWHRLIYTQTPDEFREDVRHSKRLLEDLGGVAVSGYRAPCFSVVERSLWALDVLIEEGFTYDASVFPIRHDTYGIPGAPRHPHVIARDRGRIFEVPCSTARVAGTNLPVAGGGYFRLLPYGWTRWGIGHVNVREGAPGGLLPPPLGTRPRPAAAGGGRVEPVPSLPEPRRLRDPPDAPVAGFRVGAGAPGLARGD